MISNRTLVDSDSPWLGQVPATWKVSRFGYEAAVNGGQVDPSVEPWSSMTLVAPNHIESGTGRLIGRQTAVQQGAESGKYLAYEGQLLYSKIRPALNKVSIAQEDCLCSADMYAVSFRPATDVRYALYQILARPFHTFATLTSQRVKMPKVNREELAGAPWLLPPLAEQRSIVDFLDRETAQIDTLIAKQEQLIGTLRERADASWAAMFEQAGSKGPALQLRRLVNSLVDGPFGSSLTAAHYTDVGTRVIRLGNIGINEFRSTDAAYISLEYGGRLEAHSAKAGDVVIAGLGDDRMPLGRAAVLPDLGPAIVKADCYRARPTPAVTAEYLAWALSAPQTRAQIALLARGATRARLNTRVVQQVVLPLPSRSDQRRLLAASDLHLNRSTRLIEKAEQFIAVAKERRAALITAAVTGQIDVSKAA